MCIAQLIVILVASIYEHLLIRAGDTARAVAINRAQRIVQLFGVAPVMLFWLLWLGLGEEYENVGAHAFMGTALILLALFFRFYYRKLYLKGVRERASIVKELSAIDPEDAIFEDVLERAFIAYDVDKSGKLDLDELRTLLKAIVPSHDARGFAEVVLGVKSFADADGNLSFSAFHDALLHVLPKISGLRLTAEGHLQGAHLKTLKRSPTTRLSRGKEQESSTLTEPPAENSNPVMVTTASNRPPAPTVAVNVPEAAALTSAPLAA